MGFKDIDLVPWRIYRLEDAEDLLRAAGLDLSTIPHDAPGQFMSALVRARKPVAIG